MTGGSVGGDLLAPEDVVSLLLDDVQLEQKLKEIPLQVSWESGHPNSLYYIMLIIPLKILMNKEKTKFQKA